MFMVTYPVSMQDLLNYWEYIDIVYSDSDNGKPYDNRIMTIDEAANVLLELVKTCLRSGITGGDLMNAAAGKLKENERWLYSCKSKKGVE